MTTGFEHIEIASLRSELLLRISLQNLTLIASTFIFAFFALSAKSDAAQAWSSAALHGLASLALVLQWCHHGIRTRQIKAYILSLEAGIPDTWERWLPANRPRGLLGSRWFISTKAVFIGLQAAMGWLAAVTAFPVLSGAMLLWGAVLALSAWFLLSNPKEGLEPVSPTSH